MNQCKECQNEFQHHVNAPHQVFCSKQCRNKWYNRRYRRTGFTPEEKVGFDKLCRQQDLLMEYIYLEADLHGYEITPESNSQLWAIFGEYITERMAHYAAQAERYRKLEELFGRGGEVALSE